MQADCPTLRLSGAGTSGRCYNCGQPGHLAVCSPNCLRSLNPSNNVCSALAPTLLPLAWAVVDRLAVVDMADMVVEDTQAALVRLLATSAVARTTLPATVKRRR